MRSAYSNDRIETEPNRQLLSTQICSHPSGFQNGILFVEIFCVYNYFPFCIALLFSWDCCSTESARWRNDSEVCPVKGRRQIDERSTAREPRQ